ncbi:methyl-accepting chemotaxis protein [Colwellia psychrerythraea]|uniref:Methyl-accepting chemotaxis sensory transducer with Cache sensor n=1 Tax=Colwellia psychrerythraea TaxID=28229 RepID=A0A099KLU5_COLPS|nr:methyl-accepting chemotaxis protein [Colwellia psychrerythraea]KGJ91436.1 methyl-accepting chemotaxis sensory transducer with Cache sensor [Colwellia psychrerythraea]
MLHLTIRRKVVLTTLAAVVLSILIVSAFALNSSRAIIMEAAIERELPATLGEVANNLDAQLLLPITVAQTMSSNHYTQQFIASGEPETIHQQVLLYLKNIQSEFDTISAFLVSANSGKYFTPSGLFKTLSPEESKDQWFYGFINSGKEYELSLDIDEETNIPTLFINYLMMVSGKPSAVVGVGLSLENMANSISQYGIAQTGKVFLVDQQGKIKLHPDTQKIGKSLADIGVNNSQKLLAKAQFSSAEFTLKGTKTLIASRYLKSIGWYVVAEVPKEEVLGGLTQATWALVMMGVIIASVFAFVSTWLISRLIAPFGQLADMLAEIGKGGGDLTHRLDDSRQDEAGIMARGYNQFVSYLSELLQQVSNTGSELAVAIEQIDSQAKSMEAEINEQVSRVEQIATAMHEMGMTAEEIAGSANNAAQSAQSADETVQQGNNSVVQTIASVSDMSEQLVSTSTMIAQLAEDARSIDTVVEVIRSVSEQTNLLALNAAIEAARAGEQGRGFAVVADEVRTLASRSHDSTKEIRTIIEKLQAKTEEVVTAISQSTELSTRSQTEAGHSGEHLESISESISIMNDMNLQIATATGEQSNVVGEINPHVTAVADISRANSDIVQQTSFACSELRNKAIHLNELVSRFKFN